MNHDPKHPPKPPPGFPERMWVYDQFMNMPGNWAPPVVDSLDLDQQFWLPVLHEARISATETYKRINE